MWSQPLPPGCHTMIESTMTMPSQPKNQSGFTLAEVLLASVLGAMLLTALTLSTYGFTQVLSYHEKNAGVTQELDPVLRVVTRDIREAQWAELVDSERIRLADHEGQYTDYFFNDGGLWITRPNGDTGELYHGLDALTFSADYVTRKRESDPIDWDGTLYSASTPGSGSIAFETPVGAKLSLSFVAPTLDTDVVGASDTGEQFTWMDADVLRVPLAWIPGSGGQSLTVKIYESWAPGSAKPLGSALGTLTVPGILLPQADWDVDHWNKPDGLVSIGLWTADIELDPGACYTAVLEASGDARMLFKAYPIMPTIDTDYVAMATSGSNYVTQPLAIKREITGDAVITNTVSTSTVGLVGIFMVPTGQASQTRSAALLSQAVSDDPWLGVLPGEVLETN